MGLTEGENISAEEGVLMGITEGESISYKEGV